MRVLFDSRCARSVARAWLVAVETNLIDGLTELGVVARAVDVVAIEAGYTAAVHDALDEIVALHAVFVRGAVRKMSEALLAELVVFELPVILQFLANVIADWPVVVTTLDWTRQRA